MTLYANEVNSIYELVLISQHISINYNQIKYIDDEINI